MENFEERWAMVEAFLSERFGKLPDMEAILFLIGMNEYGQNPKRSKFTKEEKQDLMHIAVCSLLSKEGYYELEGLDADGWPHFRQIKTVEAVGIEQQEKIIKECVIRYFNF